MITRIATAAVYVDDQQQAKKFWMEKAGFALVREMPMGPDASWIEVAPQGARTALVLYPKKMMPNWAELKTSLVFEADNVEATYETMKASGVKFQGELQKMQWGTFATFEDEDGNTFLLKG